MKEIKYEDLQKANETILTTDIKGKEYAEVNQRIKAFRMVYPQGAIITNIINLENGIAVMNCEVINEEGNILGTGTAYEKENSSFINKTSYIENCETSAVGRALGMAGFGIDTSVASAEEVQNAINNQNKKEIGYREQLIAYCKDNNLDINEIAKDYNLNTKSTEDDYKKALVNLKVGE